jgi:hypothetical protein
MNMNKIKQDELFGHVRKFLKNKGVELHDGSCTRTIRKGCQVLADTINLSQQAMERAKTEVSKKLEHARQVIHEKTAPPKSPVEPNARNSGATSAKRPGAKPNARKSRPGSQKRPRSNG